MPSKEKEKSFLKVYAPGKKSGKLRKREFTLGVNLAWLDGQYDHDFGNNQIMTLVRGKTLNPAYNDLAHKANMRMYLKHMQEIGFSVVRVWVFERFEGLLFDEKGFVTGIDPDLKKNFVDLCIEAAKHNLKLYLCLMDTWAIWDEKLISRDLKEKLLVPTINGLITTSDKTKSFLDKAVIPFISDRTINERIWAVDVLNEPAGLEHQSVKKAEFHIDTGITWEHLMSFVTTCAQKIKEKGVRVSCGFKTFYPEKWKPRQTGLLEYFKYLKAHKVNDYLDFYDFHEYNNEGRLYDLKKMKKEVAKARARARPQKLSESENSKLRFIIGECGQESKTYSDQKQHDAILNFLNNARSNGYAGCFIWNYGHKGSWNKDENHRHSLIEPDGRPRRVCTGIKEFSEKL